MKLTDLRPCDQCGGPVGQHFYVLDVSQAMVSPRAANEVLGTAMILGGIQNPGALAIAEVMAPRADEAVMVFGEKDLALNTRLLVCQDCVFGSIELAMLLEAASQRAKEGAPANG